MVETNAHERAAARAELARGEKALSTRGREAVHNGFVPSKGVTALPEPAGAAVFALSLALVARSRRARGR